MGPALVTGANGFIGRRLCALLAAAGVRVRAAVRSSSNASMADSVVVGEIGPDTDWSSALRGVRTVFHLAGRAHVRGTAARVESDFDRVNVAGTEALVRASAASGVRRLVFVSSVGVHGSRSLDGPFRETSPFAPETAYARSKRRAEDVVRGAPPALETVILRPPLVYGPGAPGNFERLRRWVAGGVPLPLASLRSRRAFVFVDNLCDALCFAAVSADAAGRSFLVSDGEDVPAPEFVRRLASAQGRPARLFPFPKGALRLLTGAVGLGEAFSKLADPLEIDMSALRSIGWTPPDTLTYALQKSAEFSMRNAEKSLRP